SPRNAAENAPTNTGCVDTRTTELATVVSSSDAIHVQKCPARSSPESPASAQSRGASSLAARRASPRRARIAPVLAPDNTSRHAAMTTAGAVANRTSGPAQLMARTATNNMSPGLGVGRVRALDSFRSFGALGSPATVIGRQYNAAPQYRPTTARGAWTA